MAPKNADSKNRSETNEYYQQTFQTVDSGKAYVLEMFPVMFRNSLSEIKEDFTEEELSLIVDVMSGLNLVPEMAGKYLLGNVMDRMAMYDLDLKWNVEKVHFLQKLKHLTIFQTACLEVWGNSFWFKGDKPYNTKDGALTKYVKNLLND